MLAEMTAAQFNEWLAFDKIEPLNDGLRIEEQLTLLLALFAEANRNRKQRFSPYRFDDFALPRYRGKPKPVDGKAIFKQAKLWALAALPEKVLKQFMERKKAKD